MGQIITSVSARSSPGLVEMDFGRTSVGFTEDGLFATSGSNSGLRGAKSLAVSLPYAHAAHSRQSALRSAQRHGVWTEFVDLDSGRERRQGGVPHDEDRLRLEGSRTRFRYA